MLGVVQWNPDLLIYISFTQCLPLPSFFLVNSPHAKCKLISVESIVKHILHRNGIFQDVAHFSDVSDSFRTISNPDAEGFFCCDGASVEIEMEDTMATHHEVLEFFP